MVTGHFESSRGKAHIDDFQQQITDYFRQLILASSYVTLGDERTSSENTEAKTRLRLAHDAWTESMTLEELRSYREDVKESIAELFVVKEIAAWFDLLRNLFEHFVTAHFEGTHQFPELKKWTARIDFTQGTDLRTQVGDSLIKNFDFTEYDEKIKPIRRILDRDGVQERDYETIKRHVLIRNAIQHHKSSVYSDMLKMTGSTRLSVLDREGKQVCVNEGDRIRLTMPELNQLHGTLFRITNRWRVCFD